MSPFLPHLQDKVDEVERELREGIKEVSPELSENDVKLFARLAHKGMVDEALKEKTDG